MSAEQGAGPSTSAEESDQAQAASGPPAQAPDPPPPTWAQVHEAEDRLRRALADLDNVRKRAVRERELERAAMRSQAAQTWLPVIDNLGLAIEHATGDPAALVEGLKAVYQQAGAAMAQLGYPALEAMGQPFDPTVHEAFGSVPNAEAAGTVVHVARPGYGTAEALLRPAGVIVATAPQEQ
ncbi:molecular chaperone GrpE [Kineosphaera limosa]|uniref:Protein GrpE n=1 Tax=Kineosphaera limosa NBRC 100340 TaxID=1184609 RepID=K6WT86_9MICO|nr:nucleotide exchange factor GrpE [Kineosphaera limosa]NYE02117.1 molecular chaperone GrpE [Kineosphaera limosa]GAB95282.1 protein GrpE [Kineosphaera limosa NBRC 100340]